MERAEREEKRQGRQKRRRVDARRHMKDDEQRRYTYRERKREKKLGKMEEGTLKFERRKEK